MPVRRRIRIVLGVCRCPLFQREKFHNAGEPVNEDVHFCPNVALLKFYLCAVRNLHVFFCSAENQQFRIIDQKDTVEYLSWTNGRGAISIEWYS